MNAEHSFGQDLIQDLEVLLQALERKEQLGTHFRIDIVQLKQESDNEEGIC